MIRIIEVSPRDGLQNEKTIIPTELKADLIRNLYDAGLNEIEVTSFVSPKWVPQLADATDLLALISDTPGLKKSVLVPNLKGLERALDSEIDHIALFTAASEGFVQKNINMTLDDSLATFQEVVDHFRSHYPNGWIRGYISTIIECPYDGKISPSQVVYVAERLINMGIDELSLGDTIGVGVPAEVKQIASALEGLFDKDRIAWHFHDTRGTAIANVATALDKGYTSFDSSAGGLGGCPYAPGAGGNLATEDLIYFCERNGFKTGVNLLQVAQSSLRILEAMGRQPFAKTQLAILAQACKSDV